MKIIRKLFTNVRFYSQNIKETPSKVSQKSQDLSYSYSAFTRFDIVSLDNVLYA